MMKLIALVALTTLSGCQAIGIVDPQEAVKVMPPKLYRNTIAQYIKGNFKDPYSIRSAEITKPFIINNMMIGHYYVVCVRLNAKNSFGAYTGLTEEGYEFDGEVFARKTPHPEGICHTPKYEPFTEIQNFT